MAASIEQRVSFLQQQIANIEAQVNEQVAAKRDELVGLFGVWVELERSWLANPRDREAKRLAGDARQTYSSARGGFTTTLQALLDEADTQRSALWTQVKADGWEPPA
jgi:hypothetical protein